MTAELVYGRRPVREALRGPREVLELLATQRALKAEPWLGDDGPRVQVRLERELTAEAGTQDHQGVVARVEPYRYADAHELAAGPAPLLAVGGVPAQVLQGQPPGTLHEPALDLA